MARARELSREDLGGSAFGLYADLGFDYYFKSDNAEVRAAKAQAFHSLPSVTSNYFRRILCCG